MTTAFALMSKVIARELPPKVLLFGLMNTLNRRLRTGHRRYEFERLYTEQADPWDYRSSRYEDSKYAKTLELILKHRRGDHSALEIGCSNGQFSSRLAKTFNEVTSVDFAEQAVALAREHNREYGNLSFVRASLQTLALGRRFDVITCAEILYYVDRRESAAVMQRLADHMAPGAIIVTVADVPSSETADHYFAGWEDVLASHFDRFVDEVIDDPMRPYRICLFRERAIA